MADKEPTQKLSDAVELVSEAARLHLILGEHSTSNAVEGALGWRFAVSGWEARECYGAALRMLDAMPRKR